MGYKKIGIAKCVGLLNETKLFAKILKDNEIKQYTVGCKVRAIDKTEIVVPSEKKFNKGCGHEYKLKLLAPEKTDFNIVVGLCEA